MAKQRAPKNNPDQLSLFPQTEPHTLPPAQQFASPTYDAVISRLKKDRQRFYSKEEYYQSLEWATKRRQKKEQVGYRCERCGEGGQLDVHHLNYNSLYDERMEDLMVVCRSCHNVVDRWREYSSAYDTWLDKRYGEDAWMHADSELEIAEFDDWLERQ